MGVMGNQPNVMSWRVPIPLSGYRHPSQPGPVDTFFRSNSKPVKGRGKERVSFARKVNPELAVVNRGLTLTFFLWRSVLTIWGHRCRTALLKCFKFLLFFFTYRQKWFLFCSKSAMHRTIYFATGRVIITAIFKCITQLPSCFIQFP